MSAKDKSIPEEVFIPIEDENKKTLDKRIDHVQAGLKADQKLTPNRPLKEFAELTFLIADQFDDMTTFNIKQEVINVG
tara:strand:- start:1901 stop:2134 length:234 start_codon:yes stop_codon:yes gene_type:complete